MMEVIQLILYIVLIIILYQIYMNSTNNNTTNNTPSQSNDKIIYNMIQQPQQGPPPYDYRAIYDPLMAPKRLDYYNPPVFPLATRGYPTPYQKFGILVDHKADNNDKYKILVLFGRNTYPNSPSYNYYAGLGPIKFDIKRTNELQNDDKIHIREIDREYHVVLDRMLGNDYNPYLF